DCQLVLHAAGSSGSTTSVDRDSHTAGCARCTAALATVAALDDDLAATLATLVLGPSGREYLRRRENPAAAIADVAGPVGTAGAVGAAGAAAGAGMAAAAEPEPEDAEPAAYAGAGAAA